MRTFSNFLSVVILLLLLPGCSTFNRDWKSAVKASQPVSGIEGPWQGGWSSQTNGHHGKLRCLLTKKTETEYLARFHANYRKILSFSYTVPLAVQPTNGAFQFVGDANLGRLAGGLYHYEGRATATNFLSTYQTKSDGGTFQMQRP